MTIINKSLIVITFFFAASLPALDDLVVTPSELVGGVCLMEGAAYFNIGNKFIKNGYTQLKFKKMPYFFRTPQNMKKFGIGNISIGAIILASPIVFKKTAELGEQYRKNKWQKTIASLESLKKPQEDESNNF